MRSTPIVSDRALKQLIWTKSVVYTIPPRADRPNQVNHYIAYHTLKREKQPNVQKNEENYYINIK